MGGLFSRKKTTVETVHKRTTLAKIVKFTYLQTLATDSGLSPLGDVAGETSGSHQTDITNSNKNSDLASFTLKTTQGTVNPFGFKNVNSVLAKINSTIFAGSQLNKLFGKSVSKDVKVDSTDSGWTIIKTWNQPQFDIVRYAIGIKELSVSRFTYEEVSEFISKPWISPKEVSKVVLHTDEFIPTIFPPGTYIKYYVKPNIDNADFIQINPIGSPSIFNEDSTLVPRIINFNTEKPISSNLESSYILTSGPVKEVVFKAVLTRPSSLEDGSPSDGYSPVLRAYRMLLYPKDGL